MQQYLCHTMPASPFTLLKTSCTVRMLTRRCSLLINSAVNIRTPELYQIANPNPEP